MPGLFEPTAFGKISLRNRVVMAPMTRNRAEEGGVPGRDIALHYAQRASAGLIIAEGTQPSAASQSYGHTPGLHSAEQVEGWRDVADAVHAEGGSIVVQVMHGGRLSHPSSNGGLEVVAPSALAAPGGVHTPRGKEPYPVPRALRADELGEVVEEFVTAARNAIDAGLDGVELHSANGYLLHQFLSPASNIRTDEWGGTPEDRARFVVEVTRAVVDAVGADRVGIRISPAHNIQGCDETDPAETAATYRALVDGIAPLGLAYLSTLADPAGELTLDLRRRFGGPVIANSGFVSVTSREEAERILADGLADAVAVGRPFIANPDLVRRWQEGAPLNEVDQATVYGPHGGRGYTDYPALP